MSEVFWIVLLVVFGLCIIGLLVCVLMLERNQAVFGYLMGLSDIAYRAGMRDIHAGDSDYRRWYAALNSGPTYNEMVWKFWIPLRKFRWPEPLDSEIRR